MSGGNGLLGMSLSAPVLADAAHRVGPGSVVLAFDGATACAGACAPRRPSTRPIDRRWDKSRGIVFSNNPVRPIAPDHTWARAHGIVFGNIPASSRSYVLHPRFAKKPLAATKTAENATSAEYAMDNVHRGLTMGMNQQEGNRLREEIAGLKKAIEGREEKIVELERHVSSQQEEIKQLTADFEQRQRRLQEIRTAEKTKLEAALAAQKQLVADLNPSKENLERNRAIARADGRREVEMEMRRQHEENVESLKASRATIKEQSQDIREAKRQNARQRSEHEAAIQEVQAAVKSAKAEAEEHKRRGDYLQLQYVGRQRRAKENRVTYATYRDVFDDMAEAAYDTMPKLMNLGRQLSDEARRWRNSAATFQTAKQLHLFRQQHRYHVVKKSINDFLEERSAHAELASKEIVELATKLRTEVQTMKGPAHNSRMLTRLLHFDDVQPAFALTDAAYNISMVLPYRALRDECDAKIIQMEAEISNPPRGRQDPHLESRQELVILRERRSAWHGLFKLSEITRRLKAYEALLQDDPVEKAVFMRTRKAIEDVGEVQDKYLQLFDGMQSSPDENGIDSKELTNLRQAYRDDEAKARRALDELQPLVRNRCLLEQELGQLTSAEQLEADREIKRHIAELVQQQTDLIDKLVPSMRIRGRRSRSSAVVSPNQAKPLSMEDMRSNLAVGLSAARPARPAQLSDLSLAVRTPASQRTPGQAIMVVDSKLKARQRAFMKEISREAVQDGEDDQAQDMLGLSRRIARLKPRVHINDVGKSLKMWKDLLKPYQQRRKVIASLPNAESGAVEAFDGTMTAIASNISHLKSEIKAAQIANGGLYHRMDQGADDAKPSDDFSTARLAVKPESLNSPAENAKAKGDSDCAQQSPASRSANKADDFYRPGFIAYGKSRSLRRGRAVVRKQASGSISMEDLVEKVEAKTGNVSGGTSASASGGGLNLKPTESRRSQHSLFASSSFDKRGYHQSTTFSQKPFTAATSDVDSSSHLQDAELPALDEAFSTMPVPPTRLTTSRDSMSPADDASAHHARGSTVMSTMAASASANDDLSDNIPSECSPSPTSSADTAAMALGSLAVEPSDVEVKLAYNIPAQDYRAAVMASPNSGAAFWSHRLYKGADGKQPAVFYCKNLEAAERQARLFAHEKVLGFDLEWEPQTSNKTKNIKRNVSLIQIAAEDKIALFQIALFKGEAAEELMPPTLRTILKSADVVKAGVNVMGDARRVRELLNIDMKGVLELSHLYRVVKFSEQEPKKVSFKLVSLASQVQDVLMLPLKKDENRVSAWSRELNTQQTDYAASDAYAGFRLYHKLNDMRRSMSPMPPMPGFLEQELPLTLGDGTKVYKSTWKASGRKATTARKDVAAEEEEEEEEEFLDAVEDQDADDIVANMESLDIAEDEGAVASAATYTKLPQFDTDEIAKDVKKVSNAAAPQHDASSKRVESSRQSVRPDTAELKAADAWVADWRFSLPPDWTVSARTFELRAYHLWHHQGFALKEVAALCREPPLTLTTVASYVMQALKEENLPYDPERVREPRDILPTSVHRRYQKIFDRIPK